MIFLKHIQNSLDTLDVFSPYIYRIYDFVYVGKKIVKRIIKIKNEKKNIGETLDTIDIQKRIDQFSIYRSLIYLVEGSQ